MRWFTTFDRETV